MLRIDKLLIIGATSRQSGKTELATMLIKKFCKAYKIVGLKISAIHDDYEQSGHEAIDGNFVITKEINSASEKSTSRMFAAGAAEVYRINAKPEFIETAINDLLPQLGKDAFIVCESNSLRKVVIPDLFIMIRNNNEPAKDSAVHVMGKADIIIESDGKEFPDFDVSQIDIENGKWNLNRKSKGNN